jgi:hypothetical protein
VDPSRLHDATNIASALNELLAGQEKAQTPASNTRMMTLYARELMSFAADALGLSTGLGETRAV